jgi:hypothetical protein
MDASIEKLENAVRAAEDAGYIVNLSQTTFHLTTGDGLEHVVVHSIEVYQRVL